MIVFVCSRVFAFAHGIRRAKPKINSEYNASLTKRQKKKSKLAELAASLRLHRPSLPCSSTLTCELSTSLLCNKGCDEKDEKGKICCDVTFE